MKIKEKIVNRIKKLCETRLNAKNLFHAINEFAISTLNYYVGVVEYLHEEFEELDKVVRRILAEYKVTRRASNTDRLYLTRVELGRGLQNIAERAEIILLNLAKTLDGNTKTRPIMDAERTMLSYLGMIYDLLQLKYNFGDDDLNGKTVKKAQKEKRMNAINEKNLHKILFDNPDGHIDWKTSSLWLRKGNISPQEEAIFCKLQDRNTEFSGSRQKCNMCRRETKTIDHLATRCGAQLKFDYTYRQNSVVRCIHLHNVIKYGLRKSKRLKGFKVENVISNERVKIKSGRSDSDR